MSRNNFFQFFLCYGLRENGIGLAVGSGEGVGVVASGTGVYKASMTTCTGVFVGCGVAVISGAASSEAHPITRLEIKINTITKLQL